ncbi:MAG TPA: bifunctional phosphopantothenoylcysteine decarboxylase/phosphopantothenate--cysteine ligase CoaBC [Spirochaetota bacterium]|nr:bifunctional phosphopantothenoylcysteine decarboxylase/phosphopantothenate--cysteine ligase CoaBC [Spirochaetota bacterium]
MAKIVFGVSSSISLYRTLDLVSCYRKQGHQVRVVMTPKAAQMIAPKVFSSLAGSPAAVDMFGDTDPGISHIETARQADLMAVVPATANIIAKLAYGIADDLVTTTALAVNCPLLIAPAMNPAMWSKEITRNNVHNLIKRGVSFIGPVSGEVACGDQGAGRLAEGTAIIRKINNMLGIDTVRQKLSGVKVVLTAGAGSEPIDPVRVLSNRSSGQMGFHLCTALKNAGARVTYISGNIETAMPPADNYMQFTTTADLLSKVKRAAAECDILIMAAAPVDFRIKQYAQRKIKKGKKLILEFTANPDVLTSLEKKPGQFFIGFAAESDNLEKNAVRKLRQKKLDMIIANPVISQTPGQAYGIGEKYCKIYIINKEGPVLTTDVINKADAAAGIVQTIGKYYEN